jgi:hypothetical protein
VKTIAILSATVLAAAFSGCSVTASTPGYGASAQVAYVAPSYASPGPGYVWEHHPAYGWGWHHPEHGWDKGWQ